MDLVVSPSIVGFNAQSGGHAPALMPGQLIDALVVQLIDDTTVRLSVAGHLVDVKTQVPLQPGSAVRLAVRGHGSETRLVIVGQGSEPPPAAGEPAPAAPTIRSISDSSSQPTASHAAAAGAEEAAPPQPLPSKEAPPLVPSAPARDAAPAVALAVATRAAAARQGGLAPLFAEAAVAAQAAGVPVPVQRAAQQLLALQAPLAQMPTPRVVERAIDNSGIFLEARLAAAAARPSAPASNFAAAGDLKAVLFTLREALRNWLDAAAAPAASLPGGERRAAQQETFDTPYGPAQTHGGERPVLPRPLGAETKAAPPPLPYRDAPTAGQQPVAATVDGEAPAKSIGMALLDQTEGAIARTTLLQAASLPSAPALGADGADAARTHWNLEIPFLAPQGTAVAHFEITRDGHNGGTPDRSVHGWRVNFSVDVEPIGPVHAQVSLTGLRAAVRLWAERTATAAALRAHVGELGDALRLAALEPSEVLVRDGAPPRPLKPGAGRFVDRAS